MGRRAWDLNLGNGLIKNTVARSRQCGAPPAGMIWMVTFIFSRHQHIHVYMAFRRI